MAATVRDHCLKIEYGDKMKHKNILKSALLVFLMAVLVANAAAEHKEGVVTSVRRYSWGLAGDLLNVLVDTTGNRIADTILEFDDPRTSSMEANLEVFIERGMKITFDDEGFFIYNDMKTVNGKNTKTIDGSNMLELFPAERERFKFAAQEYDRQNAGR
jgi:hypothetical protein